MGKLFGVVVLLFILMIIILSYSKFVLGLEIDRLIKSTFRKSGFARIMPDISFYAISSNDSNAENHSSCGWFS